MKRVKRGEKGVSPIVATAILVLISVVAGVLLWLWVSGFTSAATAEQPALAERIKIEAVKIKKRRNPLPCNSLRQGRGRSDGLHRALLHFRC